MPTPTASVTILKPVCGSDPELHDNLRSFCNQDYPKYRIVVGALDPRDPALATAELLRTEFADLDIRIVTGGESFGLNLKVCNLEQMLAEAHNELLVISDSDMRVGRDYLRCVTAPFEDPSVGLVTCPYRGACARGIASTLEAIGIAADFMPGVVFTERYIGMGFAFGSTIVLRRATLNQIGGLRSISNELADDYLLGHLTRKSGSRVVLSNYVIDDVLGSESFREMWYRKLRWARTTRAMHPLPVFGSGVTHTLALSLLIFGARGFDVVGAALVAGTLLMRVAVTSLFARWVLRDPFVSQRIGLLPLSDLLSFTLWAASFMGNGIQWRGQKFRISRGGRLSKA